MSGSKQLFTKPGPKVAGKRQRVDPVGYPIARQVQASGWEAAANKAFENSYLPEFDRQMRLLIQKR